MKLTTRQWLIVGLICFVIAIVALLFLIFL